MKRLTREWVTKAEADHQVADTLRRKKLPFHDARCFHAQQSAEKYLKALLEELGTSFPRTHNLEDLLSKLLPHHPGLRPLRRGLIFLNNFAVHIRYPGETANKRQADSAVRWATRVRTAIRSILGLKC